MMRELITGRGTRPRHRSVLVVVFAAVLVLAGACSSDDDDGGDASSTTTAGPADVTAAAIDIGWEQTNLAVSAGTVAIELLNNGQTPHTLVIEDRESDLKLAVNTNGDRETGSIELEAGTYTFYCDIPGHRQAGMEGTLTVT